MQQNIFLDNSCKQKTSQVTKLCQKLYGSATAIQKIFLWIEDINSIHLPFAKF